MQLGGQLVGGERIVGPGAVMAGGELGGGGQQRPGGARFHPPGRGDDPHQLVIGAPAQPRAVVAGHGVHHGRQQRARRHRVGLAALREPGQGQLLGRQAHVQALPHALAHVLAGVLRAGPLARGQRGAVRLLAVMPGIGERVLDHEPPFTDGVTIRALYRTLTQLSPLFEQFFEII